jgi:hypothetical protein
MVRTRIKDAWVGYD